MTLKGKMENSNSSVNVVGLPPCHVLPLGRRIAYSFGHILNDLCASMWFTYLLIYLQAVLNFNTKMAGGLLLWGQVADAIATPFVGYESDRKNGCQKYGRRKTWHLVGTLFVVATFPFIFMRCINCDHADASPKFAYYGVFITIFQFGWASTQVSHLSLIPDLTPVSSERVELSALRYAMTVMSNICAFGTLWLFLGMNEDRENHISPSDASVFERVALILVGIGFFFSILFHVFVKEKPPPSFPAIDPHLINEIEEEKPHLRWKDWFFQPQFYMVALLYMSTRLYINVSQIYMPLYIQDTLGLHKDNIAIIPLVMYVSSFISSFLMKYLNISLGNKITYFIGCIVALASCLWIYLVEGESYKIEQVYSIAVLIGIAGSTLLIISLSITADLIANSVTSGAFVFGCMSFVDKLANGVAVIIIQNLHPCTFACDDCRWYYKSIMVFVSGGAIVIGLVALAMLLSQDIGVRHNENPSSGVIINRRNHKASSISSMNGDEVRPLLHDNEDDDAPCLKS